MQERQRSSADLCPLQGLTAGLVGGAQSIIDVGPKRPDHVSDQVEEPSQHIPRHLELLTDCGSEPLT